MTMTQDPVAYSTRRAAAAAAGVSASTIGRWITSGRLAAEGPWTLKQLHQARTRTGNARAAHGSSSRWRYGCTCAKCRKRHNADSRIERRAAQIALITPAWDDFATRVADGASVASAAQAVGLTPGTVWGVVKYDKRLRADLDDALMVSRDPTVPHGTETGYRHGKCRCPECRAVHRGNPLKKVPVGPREVELIRALYDECDEYGRPKYSIAQIADRLGRSISVIYPHHGAGRGNARAAGFSAELIAEARRLYSELDQDGRPRYSVPTIASMLNVNSQNLAKHLRALGATGASRPGRAPTSQRHWQYPPEVAAQAQRLHGELDEYGRPRYTLDQIAAKLAVSRSFVEKNVPSTRGGGNRKITQRMIELARQRFEECDANGRRLHTKKQIAQEFGVTPNTLEKMLNSTRTS